MTPHVCRNLVTLATHLTEHYLQEIKVQVGKLRELFAEIDVNGDGTMQVHNQVGVRLHVVDASNIDFACAVGRVHRVSHRGRYGLPRRDEC